MGRTRWVQVAFFFFFFNWGSPDSVSALSGDLRLSRQGDS